MAGSWLPASNSMMLLTSNKCKALGCAVCRTYLTAGMCRS